MPRPITMTKELNDAFLMHYFPLDDTNACWPWQGFSDYRKGKTYGILTLKRCNYRASRISYMIFNHIETLAGDAGNINHTCDNPICVNPHHLWLGTHAEGMADMKKKGRAAKGEKHSKARVSDEQRTEIRERYRYWGDSVKSIAKQFGITEQYVRELIRARRIDK